jgi:hypothetical protein
VCGANCHVCFGPKPDIVLGSPFCFLRIFYGLAFNAALSSHRTIQTPPQELNCHMPRRLVARVARSRQGQSFYERYTALEARRAELVARLHSCGEARRHPSYKHALILLNSTFRKEKLAGRLAVLKSATWLINLLEQIAGTL